MMKKTTLAILGLALVLAIGGCSRGGAYKKTKSGLMYKIYTDGKGPVAKVKQFLKVDYTQTLHRTMGDTVFATSRGGLPTYAPVDSIGPVYNPAEIFNKLRKGDSAVIVMLPDSLSRRQGPLPPTINKKDRFMLTLKVLDIFENEEAVKKDQQQLMAGRKDAEIKEIEKYLADNNIKTEKSAKGVFVEITQKGDGPIADSGKDVHVMYTGRTFGGKVFDSNQDSTFGHTEPYVLTIGKRGAIEGWDDGLRLFHKGGKGRLFIPSLLAYGGNPPPGAPFKAFENLMFDVEVVDVTEHKEKPRPVMPPVKGNGLQKPGAKVPPAPAPKK